MTTRTKAVLASEGWVSALQDDAFELTTLAWIAAR